eukprot:4061920-Karenia_brevis.AAC.1
MIADTARMRAATEADATQGNAVEARASTELNAVGATEAHAKPQFIKLNVDSGAARTACHVSVGADYPVTSVP